MKGKRDQLLDFIRKGHKPCTDTRTLNPGNVFFALKGDNFNGNHFAIQALDIGAAMVVVDEDIPVADKRVLRVDDVLQFIQQTSYYYRQQFSIPFIAITGTNGKTTTKELVSVVLGSQFSTLSTSGNLNNQIGVPITLLNLKQIHQMAVIEMGANRMGDIKFLSSICDPDFGLITNVGKAHLEGFGSPENIVTAKTELYEHLIGRQGAIFVNGENSILTKKASGTEIVYYGTCSSNHLRGNIIGANPLISFSFEVLQPFGKAKAKMQGTVHGKLVGEYNLENFLAAVSIGLYFGVSPENVVKAIENYTPSNHRSQLVETGNNIVILDAYNANPTSMGFALQNLKSMAGLKKAAILGDMLELGKTSKEEHQKILDQMIGIDIDVKIVVGVEFSNAAIGIDNIQSFQNVDDAILYLKHHKVLNHTILVKGSRGIKMEKIMDWL